MTTSQALALYQREKDCRDRRIVVRPESNMDRAVRLWREYEADATKRYKGFRTAKKTADVVAPMRRGR